MQPNALACRYLPVKGLPLIQNLLPLLPRRIGSVGLTIALGGSAIGCGLWLIGARFSRPLLAGAATVGGAAIGFQSPRWFGWEIDPWAVAVLGALLLGVIGFLAHRWMAAVGLGVVLAIWTIFAAVAHSGWTDNFLVSLLPSEVIWSQIADAPRNLPGQTLAMLLVAGGVGLIGGIAIALRWPRLGTALFWTVLGLSTSLCSILAALQEYQPKVLRWIPSQAQTQGAALAVLIGVGAAAQWRTAFARRPLFGARKQSHS
jgi:hypothetical protein